MITKVSAPAAHGADCAHGAVPPSPPWAALLDAHSASVLLIGRPLPVAQSLYRQCAEPQRPDAEHQTGEVSSFSRVRGDKAWDLVGGQGAREKGAQLGRQTGMRASVPPGRAACPLPDACALFQLRGGGVGGL